MSPRFKVGDRVRIAHQIPGALPLPNTMLGWIGTVSEVEDLDCQVNYEVLVRRQGAHSLGVSTHYLNEQMLEPLEGAPFLAFAHLEIARDSIDRALRDLPHDQDWVADLTKLSHTRDVVTELVDRAQHRLYGDSE